MWALEEATKHVHGSDSEVFQDPSGPNLFETTVWGVGVLALGYYGLGFGVF